MTREPLAWTNAIAAIIVAVLPVLAAFEVVDWSVEQFGIVETFVVAVVTIGATLFARSKVTPVADPNLPE